MSLLIKVIFNNILNIVSEIKKIFNYKVAIVAICLASVMTFAGSPSNAQVNFGNSYVANTISTTDNVGSEVNARLRVALRVARYALEVGLVVK